MKNDNLKQEDISETALSNSEDMSNILEKLMIQETRTFTVVGISERLSYDLENYSASGYTIIGIPLGILAGIGGIGITFYLLRDLITGLFHADTPAYLGVSVSLPSIIISAIVAMITIFISAYIPALRSKKVSPMDAVRQTTDIKLTAKQVRTSRLTRKLFSLEGDFALKNLKKNKKRYRSTVISLFLSVVLFISASSFATYLKDSITNFYQNNEYDFSYSVSLHEYDKEVIYRVYQDILELESIKQGSFVTSLYTTTTLTKDQVVDSYYEKAVETYGLDQDKQMHISLQVFAIDQDNYMTYLEKLGIDPVKMKNT